MDKLKLLNTTEIKFWLYYLLFGIVLSLLLKWIYNISIQSTLRGFYGLPYLFFIPGFILFRSIKLNYNLNGLDYVAIPFIISFTLLLTILFVLVLLRLPVSLLGLISILTIIPFISVILFFRKVNKRWSSAQ